MKDYVQLNYSIINNISIYTPDFYVLQMCLAYISNSYSNSSRDQSRHNAEKVYFLFIVKRFESYYL